MTTSDDRPWSVVPTMRIARPTDDLARALCFYRDALGFVVVGGFRDHDGYDGDMLAIPGAGWHLELVAHRGHTVGRAPNGEHALVLYIVDEDAHRAATARVRAAGHAPVANANPYWDAHGVTFLDPDGYAVVLARGPWPPSS